MHRNTSYILPNCYSTFYDNKKYHCIDIIIKKLKLLINCHFWYIDHGDLNNFLHENTFLRK